MTENRRRASKPPRVPLGSPAPSNAPRPAAEDPFLTAVHIQETLLTSGRVPELSRWEPDGSTWRRDSAVYGYIRTLPAPIDGDRVLRILIGQDPTQRLNLVLIVNTILRIRHELPGLKKRAAEIRRLRQRYQPLWNRFRIQEDPLFPPAMREALHQHLGAILVAINTLGPRKVEERPLPGMGISVRPTKDLARQRFWTEPMVALVDYLAVPLGGHNPAYRATAKLLHLAFGFPNQSSLVERRVLHFRATTVRRTTTAKPHSS